MKRIYQNILTKFSGNKMLFVSGPRQVGKTTLSKNIQEKYLYLNWDIPEDKSTILKKIFTDEIKKITNNLIILDEIHKYHRWKNSLKGVYDRKLEKLKVIVTGSARLDVFQKSGDSLLGRYEQLRMHPFSVGELTHNAFKDPPKDWLSVKGKKAQEILKRLERMGGFPEPYLEDNENFYTKWSASRRTLLLKEDMRELTDIKLLSQIEEFGILIPTKVGSLLSLNSLKENLEVSHDSIQAWLDVFERLYYVYRIKSFNKSVAKAITKAQKLYMWDWAQVEDKGARLENLVASHLLKNIHLWNDLGYGEFELNFIRNKEKKEIDFVILNKRKPIVAIEVKNSDDNLSESWFKFEKVLKDIPKIQLTTIPNTDKITASGIRIVSIDLFLTGLN